MNQALSQLNDDSSTQDTIQELLDQVARMQADIDRANQAILQIQNVTNTGVGSVTPTLTRGGIAVPPASRLTAINLGTTMGETRIGVTWLAPEAVGSPIDHYNIYVRNSLTQQTQPTLVASPAASPAAFAFQPDSASSVVIYVQTVLANGQVNSLNQCPTTTIVATLPAIAILRPAVDSTTAIQLQNAAGTAQVTVDTLNGRLGVGATPLSKFQVHAATNENLHVRDAVDITGSTVLQTVNDANAVNTPMELRASQFYFRVGGVAVLQVAAQTNDAHTNFGNNPAQEGLQLQNGDGTTNNWMEVSFYSAANVIGAGIGAQNVTPGSSYQDLAFFTRGASGFGERVRITSSGTLGVSGVVAVRRGGLVCVNGANNDVALPANTNVKISGPTGVFNITGFVAGTDGQELLLWNATGFGLTLKDQNAGSAAANRIFTTSGLDLNVGTFGFVSLIYDTASALWIVMSHSS